MTARAWAVARTIVMLANLPTTLYVTLTAKNTEHRTR